MKSSGRRVSFSNATNALAEEWFEKNDQWPAQALELALFLKKNWIQRQRSVLTASLFELALKDPFAA
jgi:hypothetical protein